MASPKTKIRNIFPKLSAFDFKVTSPQDQNYNCIAWAAGEDDRFWWPLPQYYWPPDLPLVDTIENFIEAFRTLGYELCESFQIEEGFEKVAIYVDHQTGRTKHMARQLPDGGWTSKLGREWDITHKTLVGLEGSEYGRQAQALRRPKPN
jgi:hypothetical protein